MIAVLLNKPNIILKEINFVIYVFNKLNNIEYKSESLSTVLNNI
jgi:hypothetical protein